MQASSASVSSESTLRYRYVTSERKPIEVLVIETAPEHVKEFLELDHEVWTLGEANYLSSEACAKGDNEGESLSSVIPFISKDVWLHDNRPGEITLIFTWESQAMWDKVDNEELQRRLQLEFDSRFKHEYKMVRLPKDPLNVGLHRVARFERL